MSMFSLPEELMPDVKKFEAVTDGMTATLPGGLAGAANLFVHPFAGMAAASAVGIGLASHGFGLWLGTVSAFAETSQRLFTPLYDQFGSGDLSFRAKRSPAVRAKSAATELIEDARSTAQVISLAGEQGGGKRKR
jgi:NADH-quinone oxidoreductase subunit E